MRPLPWPLGGRLRGGRQCSGRGDCDRDDRLICTAKTLVP